MAMNLIGRSFLTLKDFTPEEIRYMLDLAKELKRLKQAGIKPRNLEGKNIAPALAVHLLLLLQMKALMQNI